MKKILLLAAAFMTLASCEKTPVDQTPEVIDEISIAPDSKTFTQEGGSEKVMVTSSSDWTLAGKETYDWIKADVNKGKDGDIVTFTADANYTGQEKTATFVFTCGKATVNFVATSQSGEPCTLTLDSEASVEVKYAATSIEIALKTNANYKHLTQNIESAVADWCTYTTTIESEGGCRMVFDLKENAARENRTANITIDVDKSKEPGAAAVEPIKVAVIQRAKPVLSTDANLYTILPEGGDVVMTVDANIEYTVTVTPSDWLSHKGFANGKETFNAPAFEGTRECKVKFEEKSPLKGEQPVVVEVSVKQARPSLVSKVIDMNNARMWMSKGIGHKSAFTIEMLVKTADVSKGISNLFGFENQFVLRFGATAPETPIASNQMNLWGGQVTATNNGNGGFEYAKYDSGSAYITNAGCRINDSEWHHVALVVKEDGKMNFGAAYYIEIYVDGRVRQSGRCNKHAKLSIGEKFFGIQFYFGGETLNRTFNGSLAEIRVWDKALTAADFKAENHYYKVDPKSANLQAYWKFDAASDKGNGYEFEDLTGNGYKLWYEAYDQKSGAYSGKVAPKLVDVALPEVK